MRPSWLTAAAAAGAIALTCATSAGAATYTFGADLAANAPSADANVCSDPVPAYGVPAGSQSCMASYLGTYPDGLTAPASGTVTQVRVRVGATTGPMRVDVIRFLFRQNPGDPSHPTSAGPFLEAYGPQFTPAANAVTPVTTSLAMQEDATPPPYDPVTIQVIDVLALEVLAPNVRIPAFVSSTALSYLAYPAPTQQGLAAPSTNAIPGTLLGTGLGVLMSADLSTAATPVTPPPVAPPPVAPPLGPPPAPQVTLARPTARVKDGVATVPIVCKVLDCSGKLTLRSLPAAVRAAASTSKVKTYGSAKFSVKAGKTGSVKVKLTKSGRALLKHRTKAKVVAKVTYASGATTTFQVTLKH
jgi:hypothetical protein